MRKIALTLAVVLCLIAASVLYSLRRTEERGRVLMDALERCLLEDRGIVCTVEDYTFQHYEYGITGGLYMYDFTCRDSQGTFTVSYRRYQDLSPDSLRAEDLTLSDRFGNDTVHEK